MEDEVGMCMRNVEWGGRLPVQGDCGTFWGHDFGTFWGPHCTLYIVLGGGAPDPGLKQNTKS